MKVWTIQLAKGKACQAAGIPVLDTTVKCGDKVFAPTWQIVLDVKSEVISQETYTELYTSLMRWSYKCNQARWLEVLNMQEVAVACMCKAGKFCHRHLLVRMFKAVCEKHGIEFELLGEWTPDVQGNRSTVCQQSPQLKTTDK